MTGEDAYGFIGVGHMGAPMAARLLAAGHRVWIFDPDEAAASRLVALGAERGFSARNVADEAHTVFLSLPGPAIAMQVALGEHGLAHGIRVKDVLDFSTVGAQAAMKIADALKTRDISYVDAPVSGGVPGAQAGSLAIMVSCPIARYERLAPILQIFGKAFHVGELPGQGQTMKLANNLLAASAIAVASEAMVMGVKAGLDPRVMLDVINAGSGRNSATLDKFPRAVLSGTFDYGFGTGLSYKDVRLCIDEAEALGVPMVVGAAVRQMLAITNAMFGAESDYTSLCKVVESWANVQVRG